MVDRLFSDDLQYRPEIGCYVPLENGFTPKYQWMIDLLALKYGRDKIRIANIESYGRRQMVAVYCMDEEKKKEFGFAIPLFDRLEGINYDIIEKAFEFLRMLGLPNEIPPVEEWRPIPEKKLE